MPFPESKNSTDVLLSRHTAYKLGFLGKRQNDYNTENEIYAYANDKKEIVCNFIT